MNYTDEDDSIFTYGSCTWKLTYTLRSTIESDVNITCAIYRRNLLLRLYQDLTRWYSGTMSFDNLCNPVS